MLRFFYNLKGWEQQFEKSVANIVVVVYHIGEQQFDNEGESVVVAVPRCVGTYYSGNGLITVTSTTCKGF
ncbi:MAG: hypothetical protein SOZ83_04995 [Sphaerochaetaceae bacterium]|nr:hypothetical protein [Sphaerochaetaceae bacterium]